MRARLPVRLKVAVFTAALTFAILCLFAVVIGAVAEDRIRSGFDDDLRATAADLQDALSIEPNSSGDQSIDPNDVEVLNAYASGGAVVRIVNLSGGVQYPLGTAALGPAADGISHVGDLRVVSRQLVAPALEPRGSFDRSLQPVAEPVGYVQYAKPENSVELTVNKVRVFLAFGVLGGTMLAFLGGLYVARRAMRPIAGLTRAAREVARTRDPDVSLPKPRANDEVSDLAHTL
jgi:two-component system, OmpR family, sensor kinase